MNRPLLSGLLLILSQFTSPPQIHAQAPAQWIATTTPKTRTYGVYHFRKTFSLNTVPSHFPVSVSADPRYQLYINGIRIAQGPARGDSLHWQIDSLDLAQYLHAGQNTLAAAVWNDGENSAWFQISVKTGFFMQGATPESSVVNTGDSWRSIEDQAYSPVATIDHITGANEQLFAQRYPWGWQSETYDDSQWPKATTIGDEGRKLIKRSIPFPELTRQHIPVIRRSTGKTTINPGFLQGGNPLTISPWTNIRILLDQQELTSAYPELVLSGGKGAKITLTYAESLFDPKGNKGNRNEIEGKEIKGDKDVFLPDGAKHRLYSPLYFRTYRYLELHIENHQETLTIDSLSALFTAYPFERKARFQTPDSTLTRIWNTAWHTARLCAYETYMDCPYYEQLQYVGDTRIQALISLYVTGDDRLMRNAIRQIYESMLPEGITQSRYPSDMRQIIPPFSLFWIAMLHDYWMLKRDDAFIRQFLPGVRRILDWHEKYITGRGLAGRMPYWNFVDWTSAWTWKGYDEISGVPDGALEGNSSILTMQYIMALQKAAGLYKYFDSTAGQKTLLERATRSIIAIRNTCWDAGRKFIADTPGSSHFSQHAQALGVLTGCIPAAGQIDILHRTITDSSLIQCSYYYRFYLLQAMKAAGLGNEYLAHLGPWKKMLDIGLSTFAENPEPTRSDCHAWSASPAYDFLATVCGIMPASPGFRTVIIEPHLGDLPQCSGSMPHPDGTISVDYSRQADNRWQIQIDLPAKLTGTFIWRSRTYKLHGGRNNIQTAGFLARRPKKIEPNSAPPGEGTGRELPSGRDAYKY